MNITKNKEVLLCIPILLSTQVVNASPVDGGTLDPTTIPKYVTPLVIPPVMNNSGVANDYDIAVRQFKQQILPGGIWNVVNGRTDNFPATTIWSYGPNTDLEPDATVLNGLLPSGAPPIAAGIAPAPNSQFNYPSYTIEATVNNDLGGDEDTSITVDWINDLTSNAWDQADDAEPGIALPHLFAVDQSLHWANPVADCESGEVRTDCAGNLATPYTGPVPIITHVHGAHVDASSDGYTEAWWLPNADNITCVPRDADGMLTATPTGLTESTGIWNVACEGAIANQLTDRNGDVNINTNTTPGVANFVYQNDQPSTTLWYHDHSLGMTRLNVMAGPAGFWLIRDTATVDGETVLRETGLKAGKVLPGPAPVAGETLADTNFPAALGGSREKYREIPIVIQGRSFNTDGSLFYPDNRAFFEGLNVEGTTTDDSDGNVAGTTTDDSDGNGQFPGEPELHIDVDPATSDIAPIWNPEAFFNTMVVNGVTWPVLEVAPALYRFRLLNGSNSRFINLALPITNEKGKQKTVRRTVSIYEDDGRSKKPKKQKVNELRFWQIGAEQSLKPTVTAVRTGFATNGLVPKSNGKFNREVRASTPQQALLMGLAERADVIVDFRGLPDDTIITMTNTAPDAPFGGFPDVPADPGTTGQVMRFVVNNALLGASPSDELHPFVGDVLVVDGVPVLDKKGRPVIADEQDLSTVTNPSTAATAPWNIAVDPLALDNFTVEVTNPTARELALVEEESALICVDEDLLGNVAQLTDYIPVAGACEDAGGNVHPTALPFAPKAAVVGTVDSAGIPTVTLWSDPIVTNVNAPLNDEDPYSGGGTGEQWNLWNFTVDGHPIHVHLVKFKVLGRTAIGGGDSVVDTATGTEAWEDGWKDTVITYPGEVTSIAADFDINGLYVWHCHIVEHEDNEMMVPMCVGEAGVDCPAQLF